VNGMALHPAMTFTGADADLDRLPGIAWGVTTRDRAFATRLVADLGGVPELERRVSAFLTKTECKVRRDVEGLGKMVDVRRFVQKMQLGNDQSRELLEQAGLIGRMIALDVTIEIGQQGSSKVSEVIEALFGVRDFPHRGVRTALLAGAGTPHDLELHRKRPLAVESPAAEVLVVQ